MKTALVIAACLLIWYVVSEVIAFAICDFSEIKPQQYDSDQIWAIRAGVFMAPAIIGILVLTWLNWKIYETLFEFNEMLPIHLNLQKPSEHWLDEL